MEKKYLKIMYYCTRQLELFDNIFEFVEYKNNMDSSYALIKTHNHFIIPLSNDFIVGPANLL